MSEATGLPVCALDGCDNPVPPRSYYGNPRLYCCQAHTAHAAKRRWRATANGRAKTIAANRRYRDTPKRIASNARHAKTAKRRMTHRQSQQRRRARVKSTAVERIDNMEIFKRDRWICQLCFKSVPKKAAHPHPMSASLDHIVPLALGGEHTAANVHLAHLDCNRRKWILASGEQLRLIG